MLADEGEEGMFSDIEEEATASESSIYNIYTKLNYNIFN